MLSKQQIEQFEADIYKQTGVLVDISIVPIDMSMLEEALKIVRKYYGLEKINPNLRIKKNTDARMVFFYIVKTRFKMQNIDKVLSRMVNRDRTTVVDVFKKAILWVSIYDSIAEAARITGEQLDNFITTKILKNGNN